MKRKLDEFTPEQHTAMVDKINEMFLSGIGRLDIRETIKTLSPVEDLSNSDVDELLSDAAILLESSTSLDHKQIILVHINHYEHIYNYFQSINNNEGMLKAMRAKERLIGMVSGPKLTVNNTTSVKVRKAPEFDWTRLTPAEYERLEYILNKSTY